MRQNTGILIRGIIAALVISAMWTAHTSSEEYGAPIVSKVDLSYLVNGRRPIWLGPVIRYTLYEKTTVEARISGLTGELILVMPLGEQEPGVYTLPWDGTMENGLVTFDGKYYFELFLGEEYGAKFWITAKSLETFDE